MYTKKLLGFSVIICSLLFLAGCGKSAPSIVTGNQEVVTGETTTNMIPTKQQCIEMMAYALKGAEYMAKTDMPSFYIWAGKLQNIQKEYNVSDEAYDQTCNGFLEDVAFMDAVQSRMAQLK